MRNCFVSFAGCFVLALSAAADVTINEIRIDQPGTDLSEYAELTGSSGESLNGLTYLVIGDGTGGGGVIECVVNLTGNSIPSDGYFVMAESTFETGVFGNVVDYSLAGNGLNFENSDNVTHMLVTGFTGSLNDDLDTNDDGVLDVTPWTSVVDSVSLVIDPSGGDPYYGAVVVGPDRVFAPGHVYRAPDGTGTWYIGLFDVTSGVDTPGEPNAPAMRTVTGTVTFEHLDPNATKPATVDIRVTRPSLPAVNLTTPLTADAYILFLPPENIELAIKHTHWLRQAITVDLTGSDASGVAFSLTNGDADGNNAVELADLNKILLNFGLAGPDGDLDEWNGVALQDLNICLLEFGQVGDP